MGYSVGIKERKRRKEKEKFVLLNPILNSSSLKVLD
jgi:hypothetical protein